VQTLRRIFVGVISLVLVGLGSVEVAAYSHPLSETKVRDAYFLGTDSARSGDFLSNYVRNFQPANPGGPYVAQIEIRTPYAQVVAKSRQQSIGYSAQQAEEDYRQTGDLVQVRVEILYPVTQPLPVQPAPACAGVQRMNDALACFSDFSFHFVQSKPLSPVTTYGTPIYSLGQGSFIGGDLWFVFPAAAVASVPLRVTVAQAGARRASSSFDLSTLL
jgi:hypothetical protein